MSPIRKVTPGLVTSHVELPTLGIPHTCRCVWIVVRAGVGWNCVSRLKKTNALCGHLREHALATAEAQAAAAEYWRVS